MMGCGEIEFLKVDLTLLCIHPVFLLGFIFYGMILKIKKFVIQWRKFESKKSSRNYVINFRSL